MTKKLYKNYLDFKFFEKFFILQFLKSKICMINIFPHSKETSTCSFFEQQKFKKLLNKIGSKAEDFGSSRSETVSLCRAGQTLASLDLKQSRNISGWRIRSKNYSNTSNRDTSDSEFFQTSDVLIKADTKVLKLIYLTPDKYC